jgi:hypothetical protein
MGVIDRLNRRGFSGWVVVVVAVVVIVHGIIADATARGSKARATT